MSSNEVNQFLTHLAVTKNVAPATQNQALCALVYLYKHVLEQPLGENTINAVRARTPEFASRIVGSRSQTSPR